jgi:iron(III) transport system ATP-binding protein
MIAGFEYPDQGSISLNGKTFAADGRALPAHLRGIGYVAQDGALFPHLTVADNIGFGLTLKGQERTRRIAELVEVALDAAMLSRWPHELSGGQQQRIALARALAQQPQLMLLDEPFSALDTGLRAAMRKMVAQLLGEAGITAILVTHDQAEALSFADQLAVMRQGRLVQAGSPQQLYSQPVDEATALFLGEAVILPAHIHQAGKLRAGPGCGRQCPVQRRRTHHAAPGTAEPAAGQ